MAQAPWKGAHDAPKVLRTGRACPHPGSREREEGAKEKERAGVGQGKVDGGGVRVWGVTRQTGKDCSDTVGVTHF
jgi:hypothetical protein